MMDKLSHCTTVEGQTNLEAICNKGKATRSRNWVSPTAVSFIQLSKAPTLLFISNFQRQVSIRECDKHINLVVRIKILLSEQGPIEQLALLILLLSETNGEIDQMRFFFDWVQSYVHYNTRALNWASFLKDVNHFLVFLLHQMRGCLSKRKADIVSLILK